jgi:hypothetical protein
MLRLFNLVPGIRPSIYQINTLECDSHLFCGDQRRNENVARPVMQKAIALNL